MANQSNNSNSSSNLAGPNSSVNQHPHLHHHHHHHHMPYGLGAAGIMHGSVHSSAAHQTARSSSIPLLSNTLSHFSPLNPFSACLSNLNPHHQLGNLNGLSGLSELNGLSNLASGLNLNELSKLAYGEGFVPTASPTNHAAYSLNPAGSVHQSTGAPMPSLTNSVFNQTFGVTAAAVAALPSFHAKHSPTTTTSPPAASALLSATLPTSLPSTLPTSLPTSLPSTLPALLPTTLPASLAAAAAAATVTGSFSAHQLACMPTMSAAGTAAFSAATALSPSASAAQRALFPPAFGKFSTSANSPTLGCTAPASVGGTSGSNLFPSAASTAAAVAAVTTNAPFSSLTHTGLMMGGPHSDPFIQISDY